MNDILSKYMSNYKVLALVGIIFLAAFFRFWQLTTVPPSLYWDEVSQGYNAYLIQSSGKDEHQESFPIARFQAFGDYKAPVNIYLTSASMLLLGKNDFAVRFPSAFLGTLTVLVTYFLVYYLFYKKRLREWYGLAAAFFLSISPWHIQLSRASFEANIATFFVILGAFLFFYALIKKPWVLVLSSVSFVLAFYSFNAHRIFVPLLVLLFALVEYRSLLRFKKQIIPAVLVGVILLLPFALYFTTPESKLRFQEVNIFSDIKTVKESNLLIAQDNNTLFAKVIHNRRVLFAEKYLENYFSFFDTKYLFFTGDPNPRFSNQSNGELFLFLIPFLVLGFYSLFWMRREFTTVIGWLLLSPIAASVAREVPHALRSETFIPTYEIIAAVGVVSAFLLIHKYLKKLVIILPIALALVIFFSCIQFWHDYLIHNRQMYSGAWQYGYKQVIEKVHKLEKEYDKIYFTDSYGRAYIYVAWYDNFTPNTFWKEVDMKKDAFGFYNVSRLGKFVFSDSPSMVDDGKILYVTTPKQIPPNAKVIDKVDFLNNEGAFVISKKI